MFRLLPVNPGPDISTAAAAVPAGLSTGQVRTVLAGLARAHIVEAADAPFQPATARTRRNLERLIRHTIRYRNDMKDGALSPPRPLRHYRTGTGTATGNRSEEVQNGHSVAVGGCPARARVPGARAAGTCWTAASWPLAGAGAELGSGQVVGQHDLTAECHRRFPGQPLGVAGVVALREMG